MSHATHHVIEATIAGEECLLHGYKAIFLPASRSLLLSDLHLGKSSHFRKHGLAVPLAVMETNFLRLRELCDLFEPEEVVFLGDLFHSVENRSIDRFHAFRQNVNVPLSLIRGNHDLYSVDLYAELGISCETHRDVGAMIWIHDESDIITDKHVVSGHVHPGVRLGDGSRNRLRLPVFCLGESRSLLPAFGGFTGLHIISPLDDDRLYAIAEDQVVQIHR